MTAAELSNLRALAKAATPGPWHPPTKEDGYITQTSHITRDVWTIPRSLEDMQFIAAANPSTVLVLIGSLEDAESWSEKLNDKACELMKERDEARELAFKWRGLWLEAKCWTVNDVMRFSWEESAKGHG